MSNQWGLLSHAAYQGFIYTLARTYIEDQDLYIAGCNALLALAVVVCANRQGNPVHPLKDVSGMFIAAFAAAAMTLTVLDQKPHWLFCVAQCVLTTGHGLRRQAASELPTTLPYYLFYLSGAAVPILAMVFYVSSIDDVAKKNTAKILSGLVSSVSVLPSAVYNYTRLFRCENDGRRSIEPPMILIVLMAVMQMIVGVAIFQGLSSEDEGYKAELASYWFLLPSVLLLLVTSGMFALQFRMESQTNRGGNPVEASRLLNS